MKGLSSVLAKRLAFMLIALGAIAGAFAQGFAPDSYHWYVPEHEKYGRTDFFSMPSFQSARVRVTSTQRFKLLGATNGWAQIEFDVAGKAYVHLRVLRNLAYDPTASDVWYEFKRASVFAEEPAKIEARLKAPKAVTPNVTDSKTPAWKRYKDSWGLKPGRPAPASVAEETASDPAQTTSRPITGSSPNKPRSKYPLLTPIGSEPAAETAGTDATERDSEVSPAR